VSGTLLGLHQFSGSDPGTDFDEHRLGLDHIAFGCANRAELETWQAHLDGLGIKHGGIVDASYGSGLSFRDPDNLPLEFFAPPG
jgi:glyoxylase I family protein